MAGKTNTSRSVTREALSLSLGVLPEGFRNRLAVHLGRPDLRFSLLQLRHFGFTPKHILDGGAFHGQWARQCLEVWPGGNVVCVEPQDGAQAKLKNFAEENRLRVRILQGLLGPEDREAFSFTEAGTGSSVLTSDKGAQTCAMWRIDSLIDQGLGPFDFVKLDVQGYELQVLLGFEQYLKRCAVLQLELSLLPLVKGAPLIAEVIAYLNQRGFILFDIDELIRAPSDGAVWQIDALFCREGSPLRMERQWR